MLSKFVNGDENDIYLIQNYKQINLTPPLGI
jgi:hypothetical protein